MRYSTRNVTIGGMDKKVLIVTADRALRREEIGDVGSIVDGYCGAFPQTGGVETWFFYADDKDLLVKNWIAANTSDVRITNLEEAVLDDIPTDDRGRKLQEVGRACTKTIYAGVEVETSKGIAHFSLTDKDQMNIKTWSDELKAALKGDPSEIDLEKGVPYHDDNGLCNFWTPDDFVAISKAATGHIFYHTTYCNHLNFWIRREEDPEVLDSITYGCDLPEDLAANMRGLLGLGG